MTLYRGKHFDYEVDKDGEVAISSHTVGLEGIPFTELLQFVHRHQQAKHGTRVEVRQGIVGG